MNIKQITHGAMTIAILILILMIDNLFGHTLLALLPILCPLPIVIYAYRFPFKSSLLVTLSASLLSFLFVTIYFWAIFTCYIVVGLSVGTTLRKYNNDKLTILIASVTNFIGYILLYWFFSSIISLDFEMTIKYFLENFKQFDMLMIKKMVYSAYVFTSIIEAYLIVFLSQMLMVHLYKKPLFFKKWYLMTFSNKVIFCFFSLFLLSEYASKYHIIFIMISQFSLCFLVLVGHLWVLNQPLLKKYGFISILIIFFTFFSGAYLHLGMAILSAIGFKLGGLHG